MVNESEIVTLIQEAKKSEKERKFKESLELYITLKDIDVKKGFAFNEVIQLPNQMSNVVTGCKITYIYFYMNLTSCKAHYEKH